MRTIVAIVAVLLVGGCTLKDGEAPTLTGPSEFALSVSLSASPDQLPRDGSSQSVVTVTVRDTSSRPVANQQFNVFVAIGTVTETSIVTGSDGRVSFGYVAPPPGSVGTAATIQVVPVGSDARNDATRTLVIRFTGASNLRAPVPDFQTTPDEGKIEVNQSVRFDASKTTDEPIDETKNAPCLEDCTYDWDFGDGSTGQGRIVTHTFTAARTYTVTLAVTDAAGTSASIAKSVNVKSVDAPTVTLAVSPSSPPVGQLSTFTATVKVATGHSISWLDWNFGDGSTQRTTVPTVVKAYGSAGTYVVTVTVTDDLGQQGSYSLSITVSSGITFPEPPFTFSPTSPVEDTDEVTFTASGVTTLGGAVITQYEWDFGDGNKGTGVTAKNKYENAATYVVRLTVTDSAGRTNTATREVTVKAP